MSEKHTKVVNIHFPLTPKELAQGIGDLRYDALQEFLRELADKLYADAKKDGKGGRLKLEESLAHVANSVEDAYVCMYDVWDICEPHEVD